MKVLVTGASGFLGGRLCHALLRHGYSVRAFVRRTSDLSSLPALSESVALELAYGDVTDYQSFLAACTGCNAVFHAAAVVESWIPDPSKFFTVSYIYMTLNIDISLNNKYSHTLHASRLYVHVMTCMIFIIIRLMLEA